ncbi:MAG: prepilin-type N-terminal cleavage/methylation domain-containing protein, partial [Plesiomonas shigelloides]
MTTSQQFARSSRRRPPLRRASQLGFTLLELLVAIAVFALLSLGIYQVVDGVRR